MLRVWEAARDGTPHLTSPVPEGSSNSIDAVMKVMVSRTRQREEKPALASPVGVVRGVIGSGIKPEYIFRHNGRRNEGQPRVS